MLSEKHRSGLSETRKITKSTMEKKRRARINNSLTELKSILSGMITHKGERFDKMEKADILELTVKCVKQLQKQTSQDVPRGPRSTVDEEYTSGMHTCMSEVLKFVNSSNFVDADPEIKTKLLDHLANKLSRPQNTRAASPECCEDEHEPDHTEDTVSSSNDSNNNLQCVATDKNGGETYNYQQQNLLSPVSSTSVPVMTSYSNVSTMIDTRQNNLPTVPVIFLPANLCSTTLGATCVIPVQTAFPPMQQTHVSYVSPQTIQQSCDTHSKMADETLSEPDTQQIITLQTPAPKYVLPEQKVQTFTPTVVTSNLYPKQQVTSQTNAATRQYSPASATKCGSSEVNTPTRTWTNLPSSNLCHTEISTLSRDLSNSCRETENATDKRAFMTFNKTTQQTSLSVPVSAGAGQSSERTDTFNKQSMHNSCQPTNPYTQRDKLSSPSFSLNTSSDCPSTSMWRPW